MQFRHRKSASSIESIGHGDGTVVLGPGWLGAGGRLFREPTAVFSTARTDDVRATLQEACDAARDGRHVVGFVAYEASSAFDASFQVKSYAGPLVWMAAYERASDWEPSSVASVHLQCDPGFQYDREHYRSALAKLKSHIREGDVYQINFTGPFDFELDGDPYALFERLYHHQPVPYAAYLNTGDHQIASCSPELFFERKGGRVLARPMKGTVRRGRGLEEDEVLERWLVADEKSRAENLMIVDLLRNDLSRCCVPGSVRVPRLFSTERYETVIQMTSDVEGMLQPDVGTADLFAALFPCGSVTGAPKVRAMQVIDEVESEPRGVYCGAIGYMHGPDAVFNVAIRTVALTGGHGRLGIGSGIVWDSQPDAEYDECLLKAEFLTGACASDTQGGSARMDAYQASSPESTPLLIETMRAAAGAIPLLERHLDRLRTSAHELGYTFDEAAYRKEVRAALPSTGDRKVRTTLAPDGTVNVAILDIDAAPDSWRAMVSETRIDASNLYRRHKTTIRRLYNESLRDAQADGFDEVIFLNERGEVAEGSRSNLVAVFGDRWVTPPIDSGALPGVYRRELLETSPELEEGVLTRADLQRADTIYLCNAIHGLVETHLALAPEPVSGELT